MKKTIFFIFCLMLGIHTAAYGIDLKKAENDLPVKISADDMEYDIDRNRVTFTGNVVVVRGNFQMNAPKMTIFMQQDKKQEQIEVPSENIPLTGQVAEKTQKVDASQNKIDKIEAYNGVKFKFETQKGSSQTASYDAKKGVLTLKGNPVVEDGKNSIRGETILYYLYERKSEVIGSRKKRVEAVFEPGK